MIGNLKALFAANPSSVVEHGPDELHLATAALLVEAAVLDGHFDDSERQTIRGLLQVRFELDAEAVDELMEAGLTAADQSSQLYGFTRVIKDRYPVEERIQMIEMLWEVIYSDGVLHDFEASLMRRVTGLIYVPDRDCGAAKKRVLERLGQAV